MNIGQSYLNPLFGWYIHQQFVPRSGSFFVDECGKMAATDAYLAAVIEFPHKTGEV